MLIPSIDISRGRAVQLRQGRTLIIDAGDPRPIAERFAPLGEIAVIDLDAAMGTGSNSELIRELLPIARCRVGGGIRDVQASRNWLDAGAQCVILGTAARPDILRELPRDRVIAALDARDGEIVVEGWQRGTGQTVLPRIHELRDFVTGFLLTFVEIEGTMSGFDPARASDLIAAAGTARVTIAGGITTADDIAALDRAGADAQVGMALYSGRLDLTDAFAAPLTSDRPDGLWPTVVSDPRGLALGLAYSNRESLRAAIEERCGVYWSRGRGVWRKGESSGATQRLLRIDLDCDRDTLRFTVDQAGPGFCHNGTTTCWGSARGLAGLETRLRHAIAAADPASYTSKLASDPALLRAKLIEEAAELADASEPAHIAEEAADLLYFALARLAAAGVPLSEAETALDRRALRLTRRPGPAKPAPGARP
jgi:phosphoribosyl-ATP pyrophosphohydrolase